MLIASGSLLKKLLLGKRSSVKTLKINNTKMLTVDLLRLPDLEQYDISVSDIVHVDAMGSARLHRVSVSAKQSFICNPEVQIYVG